MSVKSALKNKQHIKLGYQSEKKKKSHSVFIAKQVMLLFIWLWYNSLVTEHNL